MKLVAVVQLAPEPAWYHLDQSQRLRYRAQLAGLLESGEQVQCRWFDSGPWTANISEFVICEFSSLRHYWALWHDLREHPVFRHPYIRVVHVSLGYERPITVGLVET